MCGGENTSSVNVSSCFYFQAAIGAQALDYAKKTNAGPEAEKLGQQVSSMTVHCFIHARVLHRALLNL